MRFPLLRQGVISPQLANLFLHHAFDRWMETQFRQLPFERFADDAHCAMQNRKASPERSGGDSRAPEGLWIGASSGEDEGCLLQG